MTKFKRKTADARKQEILTVGVKLAEEIGFAQITRDKVGTISGISSPLIQHYFLSMAQFKKAVMREAILVKSLEVVMQGLVLHHPDAMAADEDLKKDAINNLAQKAIASNIR